MLSEEKENFNEELENKKRDARRFISGPSKENFFDLPHSLRGFADLITYLLAKKKIKHVLAGRSRNYPIEKTFSLNRCLGGSYLALDVSTFAHNERVLLL